MATRILLLPSPLLPSLAYEGLARAFRDRGLDCDVADATGATSGAELIERWSALAEADARIVAHSNAGYLAPGVRASSSPGERPIVFVDAAMLPDNGETPLAPAALRASLESLVDPGTGLLPPWTRWWPRPEMAGVIPAEQFDMIEAACPRLSLAYFDSTVLAPRDWMAAPNAYLAFGDTYAEELARAKTAGWPTLLMPGTHLELLHRPAEVAAVVVELLGQIDD